jgi:archaellum biogenesis ATPase FlaH
MTEKTGSMTSSLKNLETLCEIGKNSYNLEFSKTPLSKSLLLLLGDQSSGKSSFINHLFKGLQIRRTGSEQVDTSYTIIETVLFLF